MSLYRQVSDFPILGKINKLLGRSLTTRGQIVLASSLFFAIGSIHLDSPVYYLCGACLTVLALSFILVRFFRPLLRYSVSLPRVVTAGEPLSAVIDIENIGNWMALDLACRLNQSACPSLSVPKQNADQGANFIDSIKPGRHTRTVLKAECKQRGVYDGPAFLMESTFPFSLFKTSQNFESRHPIVVGPSFQPLAASFSVVNFLNSGDVIGSRNRDPGDSEFICSREYVPGTSVRRLDYRAWARAGKPHLKVYDADSSRRCKLLVDTDAPQPETLEAILSLSASLAMELIRQGCVIDSVQVGSRPEVQSKSQNGHQLVDVLHELAHAKFGDSGSGFSCYRAAQPFLFHVSSRNFETQQEPDNETSGFSSAAGRFLIQVDDTSEPKTEPQEQTSEFDFRHTVRHVRLADIQNGRVVL